MTSARTKASRRRGGRRFAFGTALGIVVGLPAAAQAQTAPDPQPETAFQDQSGQPAPDGAAPGQVAPAVAATDAMQASPPVAATATDNPGDIVVTGTRVRRDGFQSPNPTTVLGAEQLALTAPSNIADAVNRLPALSGSLTPRTGNAGTSGGTGGLNVLNLRNLGPTRTLILLDGRRIAGSTSSGLVNINTIPSQLVERVDVVTGGVSAAYGSDAIAGVVNFVLRTNFTGLIGEMQAGVTSRGDGANQRIALSGGFGFADGRGHVLLSGELSNQKGIFRADSRPWFRAANLVANPNGTDPARIFADNVNLRDATPGGLIIRDPANGPLQGIQFGPGGVPLPFEFGTFTNTADLMIGGTPNQIAGQVPIATDVRNRNLFGRVSFEIAPRITLFAEGSYGQSRAINPAVYQFELGNLTIQRDNAYLPGSIGDQMDLAGLTQLKIGTLNQDIGKLVADNNIHSYRGVVGIDADLGGSWSASAYYQYGRTNAVNAVNNEIIKTRYTQAIDAVDDGAGNIVCRDPANGCVPLNILGVGVASPEAIDWVTGTARRDSRITQSVASASIQGEPFSTWAGPVSIAVGGEYRREATHETADDLSLASAFFSGNFKPVNGSYNVKEAFLETVVPLARDLPFARSLELNAAVRATDYSTSGYVTTWKIGGTWRPFDDLLLRAVRSRDIRAPNLADLFAQSQFTQTVTNPFQAGSPSNTITAFLNSGNPDLKPEIADDLVAGAVYSPSWLPGFQVSLDYYHFRIGGAITSLASNAQSAVDLCFRGVAAICPLITFGPGDTISAVRLAGVNAGRLTTSGFDIETAYRHTLGQGRLTLRMLLSRFNHFTLDTGLTVVDSAGEVSGQNGTTAPHWRGSLSATYEQHGFTFGLVGRYIGPGTIANTFTDADISDNRVRSVVYLDGVVSYRFENVSWHPEVYFAVDNIFDRQPPLVAPVASLAFLNTGAVPALYDVVGTNLRAGIRIRF